MNKHTVPLLLLALAACGSVEVPTEQFYRLQLPAVAEADPMRAGTLRVHDLQLGTALDSDRLLRQQGVRLEPRPLARWVAPLDRLVTDALVLGLSRARVCDLVKGSADAGLETWSLHGRIVDFVEASTGQGLEARVRLELWLQQGDRLVFQDEFTCVEPIAADAAAAVGPDAAVGALSRGLNRVVGDVVGKMRALDLFAAARAERPARGADGLHAKPPR
ncbi:MAG: ABC-type transport auxiliary lipoprotein family protein [Planctomycetota bacterium]